MWEQAQKKLPGQMEPQGFDKIKYVVNTSRRVCRAIGVAVQHLPWEVYGAVPTWRPLAAAAREGSGITSTQLWG